VDEEPRVDRLGRHYSYRPDQRTRAYSARQRLVILTFDNPAEAQAWEDAGCPLGLDGVTVVPVHEAE
jgi:hypothetical protein